MSKINDLLNEYDRIGAEDKEAWLLDTCANYDRENYSDIRGRAALYNELGALYRNTGRLEESERAFTKALSIMETPVFTEKTLLGCKHCEPANVVEIDGDADAYIVDYATIHNNLAGLFRKQKRFDEAIDLFEKVESVYASNNNVPPAVTASCKNNLGLVYLDKECPNEAEKCFEDALEVLGKASDALFEIATTYGNLAIAHYRMECSEQASDEAKKAAELMKKAAGEDSPFYNSLKTLAEIMEQ